MTDTIIVAYDNPEHTEQAIAALRVAGVPNIAIHRHTRDGDDLTSERPAIVETDETSLWSTLFGSVHPAERLIPDDSPEAGGTVVRVTMIPAEHYEAVLNILQRFHPSDVRGRSIV